MTLSKLSRWAASWTGSGDTGVRPEPPDWQRWRKARGGCERSAQALVRELGPQAYAVALQVLKRPEDAQDVLQESFIRLWRSEPANTQQAKLSTYFHTIVLNRCRSALQARREEAHDPVDLAEQLDVACPQAGSESALADLQAHAQVREALAQLPARQRMALAMWAYADASAADIGRTLDVDANAAHQLLHRAKLALRQRLAHLEGERP